MQGMRIHFGLLLIASASLVLGQEPDHVFKYQGAFKCQLCHRGPLPQYSIDFISLDESLTWRNNDKHSQAMRLLVGIVLDKEGKARFVDKPEETVGLKMLQRLGVLSDAEYEETLQRAQEAAPKLAAAADERAAALIESAYMKPIIDKCWESPVGRDCLACHAGVPKEFPPQFDEASFRATSVPDGVSCEACHGPSDQWERDHADKAWRKRTPQDKAKLGMIDVRHAPAKANQCYSCHIGDIAEGKYIEHSWYMAGHPPLPSIELETFADQMPRHWRYLHEKPDFKELRDDYVAANFAGDEGKPYDVDSDRPQTKDVLVGGIVALRKSVNLLAEAHAKYRDAIIPDFAAFDCQACHQELRTRPVLTRDDDRFDPFIPGRPNIARWSFALADLAVDVAKDEPQRKAFDTQINDWRIAMSRQPFGDRVKTKQAADALQTLLTSLESKFASAATTEEMAKTAYDRLQKMATTELLDFHSARQTLWAMQVIATEAKLPLPEELQYPAADNSSDVARYLQIRLPAGAKKAITDRDNLPQLLSRIDAYDPEAFRELMRKRIGSR
jgi:hypothetical protein